MTANMDRAIGAVVGSAVGDALGAPYEFKPSLPDSTPVVLKVGGAWELGEWTDDTSMAIPILRALANGDSLEDAGVLGRIVGEWRDWTRTAKDVGIQTRNVLGRLGTASEAEARAAARAVHNASARSAGNGSLMRTGLVALGYLGPDDAPALATAARRLSDLTHYETDGHLHGWPGLRVRDLVGLAALAVNHGQPDSEGWPTADRGQTGRTDTLVPHPHDDGVLLGDIRALDRLPSTVDAVVSLCRVGRSRVQVDPSNHNEVWLIDQAGKNLNLDAVVAETADAIAALRAEGRTVFVHCFEAQSPTPSIGAAYAVRHLGIDPDVALSEITAALPNARPQPFFVEAVSRMAPVADRGTAARSRKPVLYIDLDNTLVDFRSALPKLDPPRHPDEADLDDIDGIFALMDPMPGAVEAFHALSAMFDTYILSTAPWNNPSAWSDKLEWVKRHLGGAPGEPAHKRLILSPHKHLNRGDYLIDDRDRNGAAKFEGMWLQFGPEPYETWADVTAFLLGRGPAEAGAA